ncbi:MULTISPECIES: hypothetical protein [Psychrobacter]|uniref:Uncharacterized protein n=1 Tax=Psychrobacter fozii TaxID=198480 RepID=A0A2V4UMA9_9GAMM|nr:MULTISPECIES: hypothetical protein [Psychrobacter]PYE40059.1 hypothetical protein DFP82_10218 [Psychrobacter fozii]
MKFVPWTDEKAVVSDLKVSPALLYRCDQAIKGLVCQPAWVLLLQAALELAGKRLFTAR